MNKKDYIGLDLAKKLKDSGFNVPSDSQYYGNTVSEVGALPSEMGDGVYPRYSYYQILTTLAKKLFKQEYDYGCAGEYNSAKVLDMLQENKPQEEIDKYIWDNLDEKWKN